jgi:hypothetical protein
MQGGGHDLRRRFGIREIKRGQRGWAIVRSHVRRGGVAAAGSGCLPL